MNTFCSIEHENPSPHELESHTLESKLSSLEKHLSASVENGSLGSPALDFEKSAKREDIDSVSEKLHWEVARLRAGLEAHKSADPDNLSHNIWNTLSSVIFRRASKWEIFNSEVSRISKLLQDTVDRRAPYIDIYQLAYQNRLAEQSYMFFCHEDDFSSLSRKYAEVRRRHRLLHRMGVELVRLNEAVFNLSTSNPSTSCQRIVDSLLQSFQIALRVNANYPDAGTLLTSGISSGLSAMSEFNMLIVYHMCQEFVGRVGRKRDLFRIEAEYESILRDSNYWRDKLMCNERGLRRHKQLRGALRMSQFIKDETTDVITRERTAQLMVKEEVAEWNHEEAAGHYRSHLSSLKDASAFTIYSRSFSYDMLIQKFLRILNSRILFSGPGNVEKVSLVYDGGLSQVYKASLSQPIELHCGSNPWRSKEVAVKLFPKSSEADACAMLLREVRVWSKLTHGNVLPLFGIWENFNMCSMHNGAFGLVSPWLDKGTLQSFLHENPSTSDVERMRLLIDIAHALRFLHEQIFRIAHGDVKANNVMLRDNKALLCDFGLSKIYDGVTGLFTCHSRNWRWQAPELLFKSTDDAEPTPESDMYSFGMLSLEVMSGRVPWEELGNITGLQKRLESRYMVPRRPRTKVKDSALWELMLRCWKDTPTLRPTAQESADELLRLIQLYSEEDVLM